MSDNNIEVNELQQDEQESIEQPKKSSSSPLYLLPYQVLREVNEQIERGAKITDIQVLLRERYIDKGGKLTVDSRYLIKQYIKQYSNNKKEMSLTLGFKNPVSIAKICEHDSCILSAIRAFRNGAVYGGSLRFFHSIMIGTLFKYQSFKNFKEFLNYVLNQTYQQALYIGLFSLIYKLFFCFLF